ncbi:unnamed protein product [Amoebophrya sp. A120]|nr:unnamed protein product [Amoebophrya sp. A120]|eukprot:GSA120T00000922001.1
MKYQKVSSAERPQHLQQEPPHQPPSTTSTASPEHLTNRPYLRAVAETLKAALCVVHLPSPVVERQNHRPEVEVQEMHPDCRLKPVVIARDENEKCQVEVTINSVRASFRFRKADELEEALVRQYTKFLTSRTSTFSSSGSTSGCSFDVLRKTPLPGWDLTFLLTAHGMQGGHLLQMQHLHSLLQVQHDRGRGTTFRATTTGDLARNSHVFGGGDADELMQGGTAAPDVVMRDDGADDQWEGLREEAASLMNQPKERLLEAILGFLEDFDRDVKDMKLTLNSHLRRAVSGYAEWCDDIGRMVDQSSWTDDRACGEIGGEDAVEDGASSPRRGPSSARPGEDVDTWAALVARALSK